MSSSNDVVGRDERTTAVPPSAGRVDFKECLPGDGVGGSFLSTDDPGPRIGDGLDGLFVQIAVAQFGSLRNTNE